MRIACIRLECERFRSQAPQDLHHPGNGVDTLFQPALMARHTTRRYLPGPGAAMKKLHLEVGRCGTVSGVNSPSILLKKKLGSNAGRVMVHNHGHDYVAACFRVDVSRCGRPCDERGNASLHVLQTASKEEIICDPGIIR